MNIFTSLRLIFIVLLSFLFTASYAQKEEDYFITVWDLSLALDNYTNTTSIYFYAKTTGDVSYSWETVPAGQSGSGKFSSTRDYETVGIKNLPIKAIIKLKIAPQNCKRIYFSYQIDNARTLIDVTQWGKVEWTSMGNAFNNCSNLKFTATDLPNLVNVTSMEAMFSGCRKLIGPKNINQWNTGNVTNMISVFHSCNFNQPIGNWDIQKVTDMGGMFNWATSFNQPIGTWNTANVINMIDMFNGAESFNQPIDNWDTHNVTNMNAMFWGASSFNQPLGNWNVKNVLDMSYMFRSATSFNQPIGNWDTQNVIEMTEMFGYAKYFNQPIGNWNTQKVTSMHKMFRYAISFNQPIGKWKTQNVTSMWAMFYQTISFNQRLDSLIITTATDNSFFLDYCGMDCKNYSYTIIGWVNNPNIPTNKRISGEGLKYSPSAQAARDILTKPVAQGGKGWTITGDALSTEDCGVITAQEVGKEQSLLSLYPNPAQDQLYLKNASPNTAYKIIDGIGREVNAGICENEEISIATLPSGLYTLLFGNRHFTFVKE